MIEAAKKQNFELAAEIKRKLEQINYVTAHRTPPWEYEVNPNLLEDRHASEIAELEKILQIDKLHKIECYDISNTSGKLATGGQVVFVDGIPEKSLYRRYKIKLKNRPDDFAMMSEVIARRLKSSVPLPELMVIDGGKGQLSAVMETIKVSNFRVIALAKRLETIITANGTEINLPDSSPALHLLQRLRDEAHRFSRKYHFALRSKKMLT